MERTWRIITAHSPFIYKKIQKEKNIWKIKIETFTSETFGEIRTILINDKPYFVGKDIAKALGYADATKALKQHVEEEDKIMGRQNTTPYILDSMGRKQYPTFINESGLYSLIFGSKLKETKEFKRWVTSEVLPTIRTTGGYVNSADLMINTYFSSLPNEQKTLLKGFLTNIEDLQKENSTLHNENDLLAQKNLEWADRPLVNSLVRAYATSLNQNFAQAWVDFKKELLYKHGINLNSRITYHINTTGKKPKTLDMLDDTELPNAISTIVALCRENDVDISELLDNKTK